MNTIFCLLATLSLWDYPDRYLRHVELRDQFITAVRTDSPVPVGIHAGLMSVVLAKAAKKSLDEHRPVKISEICGG